jgi:hypothetical protein
MKHAKEKKETTLVPRYYELEQFRRSTNRKIWLGMTFLFVVTVLSLFLALVAFARPVPVVMLDSRGRPLLFEDTASPRREMTDVRIEYFAEEFLENFVGVDSAAVEENLQKALNMMTPRYRKIVSLDTEELSRRRQYLGQNLRSRFGDLKIRIGKYDPNDEQGKIYLLASGKMVFEPRFGELEGEGEVAKWFLSQLVLQRAPVTKLSIHGLQVDFCYTKIFENAAELEKHMLEKIRKP